MFYVNDELISQDDIASRHRTFAADPFLAKIKGKRLAVCCADTAHLLALCLYVRAQGGSFYPIHADTPRLAAKRLAQRAQCHYLLLDTQIQPLVLPREGEETTGVLVQTSSGTTGEPKVITRTWQSIAIEVEAYVRAFTAPNRMTPVIACPITHSYGLIAGVLVALARGRAPVIVNQLNPKYLLNTLERVSEPLLYASPSLLAAVLPLYPETLPPPAVMTSGTLLPQSGLAQLHTRGHRVFQQYGCSEVGCIAVNPDTQVASAVGYPLPHLHVRAGHCAKQPQEIIIGEDTQSIHTRDLGYIDDTGMLHFVARIDDTINVAGLNVYPQDVEEAVRELPEIEDAVVFKRSDALSGERVCLQFCAQEKVPSSRIRRWCAKRLATYQLPVDIEQVEVIGRLANGKVNRKALSQTRAAVPAIG